MAGLKAGGVHKHKLGGAMAVNAGDAVARGLRLARRDADLLANQGIHQGRLAHVGLAHNGNQTTTLAFYRAARGGHTHAFQHAFDVILAFSRRIYCLGRY